MNIEEEIKQAWHGEHVRLWAEQARRLDLCNEMIKLELANPELDVGASEWWILKVQQELSFRGAIPSELMWKNFADAMPNLAKELKENYDNLVAKVIEARKNQEEERRAKKAKLPWYKRWFA